MVKFIDEPQLKKIVFSSTPFYIYKYLVTKWNNGIYIDEIVIFNKFIDNLSISIVELKNTYESSHEVGILNCCMQQFCKNEETHVVEDKE